MILDALHDYRLRAFPDVGKPVLATPTVSGTPGSTSYTYVATVQTINGETIASDPMSIANGPDTLTVNNKVVLALEVVPDACRTIRFFKLDGTDYLYLASSTAAANEGFDYGQTLGNDEPPTEDTSGRNTWQFVAFNQGRLAQRMEMIDLQGIHHKQLKDLGDTFYRNGDVVSGCSYSQTVGGYAVGSLAETFDVDGLSIKLGFQGQTQYTVTFSGDGKTAAQVATAIEAAVNTEIDLVDCSSEAGGYLKIQALGGRSLVLYTIDDDAYTVLGISTGTYPPLTWDFTAGKIYVDGLMIDIPAGQVEITGSGEEKVGVTLASTVVTYEDDVILTNLDENIPQTAYNLPGADRIVITPTWCVDQDGMITIQKFSNGQPAKVNIPTVYSELDEKLARRTYDVSGSFVVNNFRITIDDHPTDEAKLLLQLGPGKAYPNGHEVQIDVTKVYDLDKGRVTRAINNSSLEAYSAPGGYTVGTTTETFNVDGLNVKIKIGSGNSHTVALTGTTESADDVATQINTAINAYPTDGDLVDCSDSEGHLQIQAVDGKDLTIEAVASDAYTILGISTGTYTAIGTRLYQCNDAFVKEVSDLSYIVERVESVTHNATTHKDLLSMENVSDIIGASDASADGHDGKWDYVDGVDCEKDGNYISFDGMAGSEPANGATYYVKYRYRHNPTRGTRTLVRVVDAQITKGVEYGSDSLTFTGATSVKRISDNVDVTPPATPKDVVRVLRVNNSAGQGSTYYTDFMWDKNSDALTHAVATIDWSGAGAAGSGATGQPVQNATYYISFEYWHHDTEGDYVSADSYDDYTEIELAPNDYWQLRDCVDFRTTSGVRPLPSDAPVLDYEYYLPRRDKVMLSSSGEFLVVSGEPSPLSVPPKDVDGLLSLAILAVPAYTYSKNHVVVVSTEPVRITQYGMRNLERRIERLEYWEAVNGVEKEAATKVSTYDSKGLFADALTGWNRQDVSFDKNGITNNIALDRFQRVLLLPPDQDHDEDVVIEIDLDTPGVTDGVIQTNDGLILDYDPEVFDRQTLASMWMNCAPDYNIENYYGRMSIYPTTLLFYDKEQLPSLNVDFDQNLESLLNSTLTAAGVNGMNWGAWRETGISTGLAGSWEQMAWISQMNATYGNFVGATATTGYTVVDYAREGTSVSVLPGSKTIDMGNRVVDLSMQQKVQTTNSDGSPLIIQIEVYDVLPNQDHACQVAGKIVDLVYDASPISGNAFGGVGTNTYLSKTTVKADNDGRFTAKFTMPSGIDTGEIPVTIFYYADRTVSSATSSLFSSGFVQKNQQTTVGIENPSIKIDQLTEMRREATSYDFLDPIAQSFMIRDDYTYVSAVELYFKSKHSTLGITVELRDTVNGSPGNHIYSTVKLTPSDVNISPLGTLGTVFTFPDVLGYRQDEWLCFVIKPEQNNTGYEIFCAEKNQADLITGSRIVQPHHGSMYHSPNLNSWQEMTTRDLKFHIYKSNFVENAAIQWKEITGVQASRFITKVEEVVAGETNVKWFYSLDSGVSWNAYNPRIDIDLEAITTKLLLRADVTALGGFYQIAGAVGIKLRLHQTEANYITTAQTFSDPLALPNTVFAFADIDAASVNGSGETDVTAYYSTDDGETWTELPLKVGYTPVTTTDPYYRYEWELASPVTEFSSFRGRLNFTTTNASKTPRITNGVSFICSRE